MTHLVACLSFLLQLPFILRKLVPRHALLKCVRCAPEFVVQSRLFAGQLRRQVCRGRVNLRLQIDDSLRCKQERLVLGGRIVVLFVSYFRFI